MTQSIQTLLDEIDRILTHGVRSEHATELLLGKEGLLRRAYHQLKSLPQTERRSLGKALHEREARAKNLLGSIPTSTQKDAAATLYFDPTFPGGASPIGHRHPVGIITNEIVSFFTKMNFQVREGTEIETAEYNFDLLNIPPAHPAREAHDTIWINRQKGTLLRTHTSPMQIRVMAESKPPLRVIVPGRVYRYEAEDATHASVFHQVEGFVVQQGTTVANLKWTLHAALESIFGRTIELRFRPSYFPFTQPSLEIDLACIHCEGKGCAICKQTGWLEILGAGMIHPQVLKNVGYNPARVSGFAFGVGIERLAMIKYKITDIRSFLTPDRFVINQFPGVLQ